MPAKAVVGEGIETMPLGRRQRFPTKEVYVRPSGPSPVRALAQFCGTGGMAVEAHVAPNQAVAASRGGRVIGQSTRDGGEPATENYTPANLVSTILHTVFDVGQLRLMPRLATVSRLAEAEPIPLLS